MSLVLSELKTFLMERGWFPQPPGEIAKSVSIEAAELLECFQWQSPSPEELLQDPERLEHVRQEVADVLIYCYQLCLIFGWSPDDIVRDKQKLNALRYPIK